jgi:hypothetical protein
MILIWFQEVLGSNIGWDTSYPEVFHGYPQTLQENAGGPTLNCTTIAPFHILSNPLFTILQSFDAIQPVLLTMSLNKLWTNTICWNQDALLSVWDNVFIKLWWKWSLHRNAILILWHLPRNKCSSRFITNFQYVYILTPSSIAAPCVPPALTLKKLHFSHRVYLFFVRFLQETMITSPHGLNRFVLIMQIQCFH